MNKRTSIIFLVATFITYEAIAANLPDHFSFPGRASTSQTQREFQIIRTAQQHEAALKRRYQLDDTVGALWGGLDFGAYRRVFSSIEWIETGYSRGNGQSGNNGFPQTPLLLDLERNGFNLGERDVGVSFDITASGNPRFVQWVASDTDDGFLVVDLNNNGVIDDGSELFGEGTTLKLNGEKASNGYAALRQYDLPELGGNGDNRINRKDKIWDSLKVWVDKNADGFSQLDEITGINDLGIKRINLEFRATVRVDSAGNVIPFWSWVVQDVEKGPKRLKMADVYFRVID